MRIYRSISSLIYYAQRHLGLRSADVIYATNNILDILNLTSFEFCECGRVGSNIDSLLSDFCEVAEAENIFAKEDEAYYCDKIMGVLSKLPSRVNDEFQGVKLSSGGTKAMDWFYSYCVASNYVKKAVLDKNPRFDADNGLIVTINLAKPEFRDPKKAASGNSVQGGYPQCVICKENEGLVARNKCTLRTISIMLNGKPWFWQFSPYGYFYQHGIAVNTKHIPMHVDSETFVNLMDFVDQFPGYFIGCNAALERIGGSVLSHDHYQGGGEILPLHKAKIKKYFSYKGCDDDLQVGYLDWPGNVIRIVGSNKKKILTVSEVIRKGWENFTDESQKIVCRTEKGQHNAVSPTVVKKGDDYEINIILRSNITSEEYPDGIFHAHPEFHIIKKESIGLIEAQGLFILPGRLVGQLSDVEKCICNKDKLPQDLADFKMIYNETKALSNGFDVESVHDAMKSELASVCYRILQNTAVFKSDEKMTSFMEGLGFEQK